MIRIPGKIPVSINWSFWIVTGLIGYLYSRGVTGTLIWMAVIFISVLFHELGHALTALAFKLQPRIELVAMGGVTQYQAEKLSSYKRFLIVLNGPLFGFLLFLFAKTLLQNPNLATSSVGPVLLLLKYVNFFWTIVNLIPVLPLDGGQLLRVILEGCFGFKGLKYSFVCSSLIALFISLASFLFGQVFIGALFFLFAFQSFDTWKKSKLLSEPDQNIEIKNALIEAEQLLQKGQKKEALCAFENVRIKSNTGVIYNLATQYQAFLEYDQGNILKTYELLKNIKNDLAPDASCLLHKAAFEEKDYTLVVEIGSECYKNIPTADIALRNAYAHAGLKQVDASIGWMETAIRDGLENVIEITSLPIFDSIRNETLFVNWIAKNSK
ncbi:MAG: stage IV sporulation protein FB [Chlamydiae bacterium]|nr:stage IV sporulation protein FB [Chlamydiota bacterium]